MIVLSTRAEVVRSRTGIVPTTYRGSSLERNEMQQWSYCIYFYNIFTSDFKRKEEWVQWEWIRGDEQGNDGEESI
jgi:hypothetical protein